MHIDWQIFVKPYIPIEDYVADKAGSRMLSTFIFFVVLGFITSFALISKVEGKQDVYSKPSPATLKAQEIQAEIDDLGTKNDVLESEILILNHSLTQTLEDREQKQILDLSGLTGSHKNFGAGVVLSLSDSDKPLAENENPNLGLIHNSDLIEIINDLWQGGAKAVSVNDQRITSRTGIICVGSVILINKTRIAPPFVVKATGNPEKLEEILKNGHIKVLELSGIKYSIEKYDRLEIPADSTTALAGEI